MGNRLLVFKYHQHTDIYRSSSSSSSSSKYHQNTDHYQKASKSKVEISLLMRCYHIIPQNPIKKKKKHKKKANDRKSPKNLYRGTTSDSSAPHSAPGAPAARQRGVAARAARAAAALRRGVAPGHWWGRGRGDAKAAGAWRNGPNVVIWREILGLSWIVRCLSKYSYNIYLSENFRIVMDYPIFLQIFDI